jgi:hypothetical protein
MNNIESYSIVLYSYMAGAMGIGVGVCMECVRRRAHPALGPADQPELNPARHLMCAQVPPSRVGYGEGGVRPFHQVGWEEGCGGEWGWLRKSCDLIVPHRVEGWGTWWRGMEGSGGVFKG